QAEDGFGQSRGGFTTKVHLICTDEDTAVAVRLTPGQAGDAPPVEALFRALVDAGPQRGPGAAEGGAGRGDGSPGVPGKAPAARVAAQIPSKRNAVEPWPVLEESYRERNRVERLVNKMKPFRAVATRYDKLGDSFLATIKLVLCFIKVRSIVNRT